MYNLKMLNSNYIYCKQTLAIDGLSSSVLYKVIFFKLEVQSSVPANILQNILVISEKIISGQKSPKKKFSKAFWQDRSKIFVKFHILSFLWKPSIL